VLVDLLEQLAYVLTGSHKIHPIIRIILSIKQRGQSALSLQLAQRQIFDRYMLLRQKFNPF
jgi:hypothetical protein